MPRPSISSIVDAASKSGIIPLFCRADLSEALDICHSLAKGGARLIEFTNRSDHADLVFDALYPQVKAQYPEVLLGAGSINSAAQAVSFIGSGADFIVSPFLSEEVGEQCKQFNRAWIPGSATLSEMQTAVSQGAAICKLFPASNFGVSYLKSILAPCPELKVMPTGGVTANRDDLLSWKSAGACCVGLGSALVPSKTLKDSELIEIENRIKNLLAIWSDAP